MSKYDIYFLNLLFYPYRCCASMCVCELHSCLMPMEARKGTEISGTIITDSCTHSCECECWKSNPGPLQEKPPLLTASYHSKPNQI